MELGIELENRDCFSSFARSEESLSQPVEGDVAEIVAPAPVVVVPELSITCDRRLGSIGVENRFHDRFDRYRSRDPAVAGEALDGRLAAPDRGDVLAIDRLDHAKHPPRDPFGLSLIGREIDLIEHRPTEVAVLAPHSEGEGEAPHRLDEDSSIDVLREDLQVGERFRNLSFCSGGETNEEGEKADEEEQPVHEWKSSRKGSTWRSGFGKGFVRERQISPVPSWPTPVPRRRVLDSLG